MVVKDLQQFSIVEDVGFLIFVHKLQPLYQVPSRKTLSNVMLNNKYNEIRRDVVNMIKDVEHMSITTDIWTSDTNKSFLSVTSHFLFDNVLSSRTLNAAELPDRHTGEHISQRLENIFCEWDIKYRVTTIVADNASNVKSAVEKLQLYNYHPCLAHTLNLTVKESISKSDDINTVIEKSRRIVTHFKHSVTATSKLEDMQKTMQMNTGSFF